MPEKAFLTFLRGSGEPSPTDIEMVKTSFAAAMRVTAPNVGETNSAPGGEPVEVFVAHGSFTPDVSRPPGAAAPTGTELWAIVNQTGGLIGDGLNRVRSPDLSVLGTVTRFG